MAHQIHEAARFVGGSLTVTHSHLCGTRRGADCGCNPQFRIRRQPKRTGGRR